MSLASPRIPVTHLTVPAATRNHWCIQEVVCQANNMDPVFGGVVSPWIFMDFYPHYPMFSLLETNWVLNSNPQQFQRPCKVQPTSGPATRGAVSSFSRYQRCAFKLRLVDEKTPPTCNMFIFYILVCNYDVFMNYYDMYL